MTQKHHPDLILMDLRMPVMDGNEAARNIKRDDRSNSIHIIAVSASADLVIKCGQSDTPFDDYLMKPIRITELFELLKK